MSLSLSHHYVNATWHDDSLARGKIIFFKKQSKIKNNSKKIKKIEELTCNTPFNGVNSDLTERANLRRFNKKGDHFETFKILGSKLRF